VTDDERYEAQLRKIVGLLRADGLRYEEIADSLEGPVRPRLELWEVYRAANPTKTAAQVAAWRRKH